MSKELYIVFIINNRYVRWECFPLDAWIIDTFILLENKYNIKKCIQEANELYISKNMEFKLIDICTKGGATLCVTTKDKNYTLSKDIN